LVVDFNFWANVITLHRHAPDLLADDGDDGDDDDGDDDADDAVALALPPGSIRVPLQELVLHLHPFALTCRFSSRSLVAAEWLSSVILVRT